jgi:hypothetical protein
MEIRAHRAPENAGDKLKPSNVGPRMALSWDAVCMPPTPSLKFAVFHKMFADYFDVDFDCSSPLPAISRLPYPEADFFSRRDHLEVSDPPQPPKDALIRESL